MKYSFLIFSLIITLFFSCNEWQHGEAIYSQHCSGCHGVKGEGLANLYPALLQSNLIKNHPDSVLNIVINGSKTTDSTGMVISEMFPIPALNAVEYTNLLNYLNAHFGDPSQTISTQEVNEWMKKAEKQSSSTD